MVEVDNAENAKMAKGTAVAQFLTALPGNVLAGKF